ncbi:hypothetical protein A8L34_28070 [Bacillus sp. FJAT-27264]|uniref:hypothetical protein n=1 Tax=Paenibacillus sp. (strain DSM 101736 / FJAT-27264) TaxID=1850362 RepID=UPI0008080CBC|nr:hypothetical protein [Bacillus sp. FJAT-27264]OBZ15906.1 hypothetical protein A8L34_28070 [Bacillus sp. FJAT-27264]
MTDHKKLNDLKREIKLILIGLSIFIFLSGSLTALSGKTLYAFPLILISLSGILALVFKVSKLSSFSFEKPDWKPLILQKQTDNIKEYLKTWVVKHPFVITFSIGFLLSLQHNLNSLTLIKNVLPQIPVTYQTAYILLSVFIFYDLFYLVISKIKHPTITIIKVATGILYLPIYIYVGTIGAVNLIKFVFGFLIRTMIGLVKNEFLPHQIMIGTFIIILILWVVSYSLIKSSKLSIQDMEQ